MRRYFMAALLCPLAGLAACGGDEQAGNRVQMRDMEVVDGTISDDMTDLDAARADGTAMAPAGNEGAAARPAAANTAAAADPAETVADE